MTSEACIVAAARSWVGTRFHHQGRLKKTASHKGGVDCLGLLIGVAQELNLRLPDGTSLAAFDESHYPHFPDTHYLQQQLATILSPIGIQVILPGNVLLLNIDKNPQHLAIVSDVHGAQGIIHAYAPARSVVEHQLDDWWRQRIVSAYRLP